MASSTEVISPALEMSESAFITSEEKTPTMSCLLSQSEDSLAIPEDDCLDQSYGPYVNEDDTIDTCKQEDEEGSSSALELMLSLYLPLMLLGFRRSMSITANLVRFLIFGHAVQYFFGNMSEWMTEKTPWLQPLFSKGGKGTDPHAWPPAALVALGILTVVALVVHPDGFTWVVLSRTRDTMLSLFHSSATCWGIVVKDYGVIPTAAAAATFAVLFSLLWIIHRTLSRKTIRAPPKTEQTPAPPEKRKKKKKGPVRNRGRASSSDGGGGIKAKLRTTPESIAEESPSIPEHATPSQEQQLPPDMSIILNDDVAPLSLPTPANDGDALSPSVLYSLISDNNSVDRQRSHVLSVSNSDTSTYSDDTSCESVPSLGVASYVGDASTHTAENGRSKKQRNNRQNGNRKCPNKKGATTQSKNIHNSVISKPDPSPVSSRWDVLKPSTTNTNHAHRTVADHLKANTGSGRRGGGQYNNNKKGRPHATSVSSTTPDSFFARNKASFASSTPNDSNRLTSPSTPNDSNRLTSQVPIYPPSVLSNQTLNAHGMPPASNKPLPLPPPGLGPLRTDALPSDATCDPNNLNHDDSLFLPSIITPSKNSMLSSSFLNSQSNNWSRGSAPPVSQILLESNQQNRHQQSLSSPDHVHLSPGFDTSQYSPSGSIPFGTVKENPFAPDYNSYQADLDSQIEADLQELGGQMAGSILDF